MYAAATDTLPLDVVKLLVERGADVNARAATSSRAMPGSVFSTLRSSTGKHR